MTSLQILLLLLAVTIFALFFKQLFSGNHPKRGVDFEPKVPNEQVGGVSRPDKIFKKVEPNIEQKITREQELLNMAKESLEKDDITEANKALQALLIREPNNLEALRILGTLSLQEQNYNQAKENFTKVLNQDNQDDLTHNLLANTLHKLELNEEAIKHHKKALELDSTYAPYYFNYANTLYDLKEYKEALELYKKALELEPTLEDAKKMISEIENGTN
jgi:tetratricopeptide (TPR) repeat protein